MAISELFRLRKNTSVVIATIALILAGLYFVLPLLGYNQPPEGTAVVYELVLLYNATKILVPVAILLAFLISLAIWRLRIVTRQNHVRVQGLAVILLLCASLVACSCSYISFWEAYQHLDTAQFNGRQYKLGIEWIVEEGDVVFCGCDDLGFLCRCHDIYPTMNFDEPPHFVIDSAANVLSVRLGERTIYEYQP